jgi:hypothetical protein
VYQELHRRRRSKACGSIWARASSSDAQALEIGSERSIWWVGRGHSVWHGVDACKSEPNSHLCMLQITGGLL